MKVVNEELDAARRDVKKPQNHYQIQQRPTQNNSTPKVCLTEVRKNLTKSSN